MRRSRFLALTFAAISLIAMPSTAAEEWVSHRIGGTGGEPYNLNCGANAALVGLNARTGSWIDGIEMICRRINRDGSLGEIFTHGSAGGEGGYPESTICPGERVVTGLGRWNRYGRYVDWIDFRCSPWNAETRTPGESNRSIVFRGTHDSGTQSQEVYCPGGKVVKGLRGRAGQYLDSLRIVCNQYDQ